MRTSTAHAVLIALFLGCAASPGTGAPLQGTARAAAGHEDGFTPIRFGDPGAADEASDYFPGTPYRADVARPSAVLGQPVGTRPAHPHEILEVFRAWADSPRVDLQTYAHSFEGRELVRVVITSEANLARLDEIRRALAALADPRGLSEAEAERLVASTPACAWLGYSIHGDEISGADASMAVGYHLVAGESADVASLLDDLIVVLDPVMNPDGRERFVSQLEQTRGYVPNMDYASMQRGRWPEGRGNHYLFDMNRDWIAGIAPETRGRWRAVRDFNPQLFVDAHEMGALDTYLFYPQSRAHNPHLPTTLDKWHRVFGDDQGAAFDAKGWGFYTREWADGWGPFYSDAWGSLNGAIGILYEMAGTSGQPVMRASGEVVAYRSGVHKQATSSLANLRTLQANREEILRDFLAGKRATLEAPERWFVCHFGRNRDREDELVRILLGQGIEVFRATSDGQSASSALDALGGRHESIDVPAGSLLVPARQPRGPLVQNLLGFDIRMNAEDLQTEREELERKGESNIYDVTAWGLPHALDLDAYWCELADDVERERVTESPERTGAVLAATGTNGADATAWAIDGRDDAAVAFAAQAMELGVRVHFANKAFTTAGRTFARGSLLVRRHENEADGLEARLREAATRSGATVHATAHGRSPDDGPDLGGTHFELLARPRIAVLSNSPVRRDTFGHLWYALDFELRVPYSLLDATSFGAYDLRRYNVLVLPPASGSLRAVLEENAEALESWVRGGGTLVACGSSAAMLANADLGLSAVRLRRDSLDDLESHAVAVARERAARTIAIDEAVVWGAEPAAAAPAPDEGAPTANTANTANTAPKANGSNGADAPTAEEDAWQRRFAPAGVFLRGEVDPHAWVTAGITSEAIPIDMSGSNVLLAKPPVRTAIRFAAPNEVRVSGLVWPEARARVGDSAYLTVEPHGAGQVILFASSPGFRGYFRTSARLFANAVVYGPGAGASQPIGW